jgi:putative NADH-flavin reductase
MTITVFGATGKIGKRVVVLAIEQSISVRAFVHSSFEGLPDSSLVTIVHGNAHLAGDVIDAIRGSDAVISCLGSWGTPTKDILSKFTQVAIPAMNKQRVKRLITLTGADALAPDEQPGRIGHITHTLFSRLAPQIMRDSEEHLRLLEASSLDWTSLRSPVMLSFGAATNYKLQTDPPKPWQTIGRDQVASAILRLATSQEFIREAPFITRN